MFVCVYSVFVLSCIGSGLATGWSLVQGVLPIVYNCKIKEPHKRRPRPYMGWSAIKNSMLPCLSQVMLTPVTNTNRKKWLRNLNYWFIYFP
jgi:hypothetical protein